MLDAGANDRRLKNVTHCLFYGGALIDDTRWIAEIMTKTGAKFDDGNALRTHTYSIRSSVLSAFTVG